MKQLVSNLPQENKPREVSDSTVAAILACLDEAIQHNVDFARYTTHIVVYCTAFLKLSIIAAVLQMLKDNKINGKYWSSYV